MESVKSLKWYIRLPNKMYAFGPVVFEEPVDETELRKYARSYFGVTRLPKRFECWPTKG